MKFDSIDPIERFLKNNEADLPEPIRAAIREIAAKSISGQSVKLEICPEPLRDDLRRAIAEYAYQRRNVGKAFDPNMLYMPTQGSATSSLLFPSKLL